MGCAAAAPPDGATGPVSYEAYVTNRLHLLQQAVRAAAGDMRLYSPAALAENHPACRTDADGDALLPNGQAWRPALLLSVLASKLLSKADAVLKVGAPAAGGGDSAQARMLAMFRGPRLPPMPHLLSTLIQPKAPRVTPDEELEIMSVRDIKALPDESRQFKEMSKRRDFVAVKQAETLTAGGGPAMLPSPEPALTPTFDPPVNGHRYAHLESSEGWVSRPQVEPTALDHDDGVEGMVAERHGMLRRPGAYLGGVPFLAWAQVHKDKNSFMLQSQAEASLHHQAPYMPVTTSGVEVLTTQRDVIYTARSEPQVSLRPGATTAVGLSASRLVEDGGPPTKARR